MAQIKHLPAFYRYYIIDVSLTDNLYSLFYRLVSLVPSMLGQFETMFGNTTEWVMMEHIINVVDVFVLSMRDRFDDIAGK